MNVLKVIGVGDTSHMLLVLLKVAMGIMIMVRVEGREKGRKNKEVS